MCSWDRFLVTSIYPAPGEYAVVERTLEQAGGTTANTCAALARVGIDVTLASFVGDDQRGQRLIESLVESGCNTTHVIPKKGQITDSSYIVVSGREGSIDRTIYWLKGAKPELGDALPVDELLDCRWLVLDVDDPALRSFWLDLPAHRSPRTQLVGLLTYLVELTPTTGLEQALHCNVVIGNEAEFMYLTDCLDIDSATAVALKLMPGTACRKIYISRGSNGSRSISSAGVTVQPAFDVPVVDTTGAGDAFAAGCVWGLVESLSDTEVLKRGNALGGLTCTALGARTAHPSIEEAVALMQQSHDPPW